MKSANDFRTNFIEALRGGEEEADAQQGPKRRLTYRRFRPFSRRFGRLPLLSPLSRNVHLSPPPLTSTLCCQITCQRRRRGGGRRQRGEAVAVSEGARAVAHLNGYPAYPLPCHVSLGRFLGRGPGNNDTRRPRRV